MEKTRLVADYSQVHNKGGGGGKIKWGASRILKNYEKVEGVKINRGALEQNIKGRDENS